MSEPSGWNYISVPPDGKDSRKFVTLVDGGMTWVGIRAWHTQGRYWMKGGEPERAQVLAWMDMPEPARGRWVHGQLIGDKEPCHEHLTSGG